MEANNKNNKLVIILLFIIILVLVTFTTLLVTNTITFNISKNKDVTGDYNTNNNEVVEKEKINTFDISYTEEEVVYKSKNGYIWGRSKRNLPIIKNKNNQNAADKIATKLTKFSDDMWAQVSAPNYAIDWEIENDESWGVSYIFKTGVVTDNRLTFELLGEGSMGGVSWTSHAGYDFNAVTGELLTLEQISNDYNIFKTFLVKEAGDYIETIKDTSCINSDYQNNIEEIIAFDGNWYFQANSLTLVFPKYSIACGAGDVITVDIVKDKVNSYLKNEYKI